MVRLWTVYFLQGMTQGFWMPALTNILTARGMAGWVPMAFMVQPLCSLVAPLVGGALADQRVSAERLFGWFSLAATVCLLAAFGSLDLRLHPMWFIAMLGAFSLFSSPTWGLIASISLAHLPQAEKQFPLVRVGATVGWVVAGCLTSYVLAADTSTLAGHVSAASRLLAGVLALGLPLTLPQGAATSWRSRFGFDAFRLFRERDHAVFFIAIAWFSIPITAFYMYAPEFLRVLGDAHPTGTMTIAQVLECFGMLGLGAVLVRFRVKTVLLWAIGLTALRFGMSAWAGVSHHIAWHIAGVGLHGICYALFFVTAQVFLDRRVVVGMRAQAQGLFAMVSGGLGPLAGAWFCAWLRQDLVGPDGQGWGGFWCALAAMVSLCGIWFACSYRGLATSSPRDGSLRQADRDSEVPPTR